MENLKQVDYKIIRENLEKVKVLYRNAIDLEGIKKERFILNAFIIIGELSKDLEVLVEPINKILEKFKEDESDINLIKKVKDLLEPQYKDLLPSDDFAKDMIVFKFTNQLINITFGEIYEMELNKSDKNIIDRLKRIVYNMLVDNPNFKGSNPYYKREYNHYRLAQRTWLEFLDADFNAYIDYFTDEE